MSFPMVGVASVCVICLSMCMFVSCVVCVNDCECVLLGGMLRAYILIFLLSMSEFLGV